MMRQSLDSIRGISLIAPCTQIELVRRMREVHLMLSDSGGIQEEATALGTPLLVLREKTERPEAIASGNARLVGTSPDRIVAEVRRLLENPSERLAMARPAFPFGDGTAGPRIAEVIHRFFMVNRPQLMSRNNAKNAGYRTSRALRDSIRRPQWGARRTGRDVGLGAQPAAPGSKIQACARRFS